MSAPLWTDRQGRKHEIKWMDSLHLVHSANMMLRQNKTWLTNAGLPMLEELCSRGLYFYQHAPPHQLVIPPYRESTIEMCMLRAILDTLGSGGLLKKFREGPAQFIEELGKSNSALHRKVFVQFVKNGIERS